MLLLALFCACTGPHEHKHDSNTTSGDDTATTPATPPGWDPGAAAIDCTPGGDAPLLDAAFANAGLDRADFGYTSFQWNRLGDPVLNPWLLSWYTDVHNDPEQIPCFAGQIEADVDTAAASAHPVASALTAYAVRADVPLSADPIDRGDTDFATAIAQLSAVAGGAGEPDVASLDPDLADALVPVILAISDAVALRHTMDDEVVAQGSHMPKKLFERGAGMVIATTDGAMPDLTDTDESDWFTQWFPSENGPRALVDAARRIAFAIEDADLERFAGGDTSWEFQTDAGAIRISPAADDTHAGEGPVLFHLELGGNDTWLDPAGANADEDNPVSIVVDLGGDDRYGYDEVPDEHDAHGTLVSDEDGRLNAGNGMYISRSRTGRQGSGRYGIGMLFDLGGGSDTYESLRMSQGFGALGVGVLRDDAGNDTYSGEAGVQGSAVFGVGLLLDGGGTDTYRTWAYSQGFAYVASAGMLYDAGDGDDVYWSDPGNNFGGTTLYYSPQLAGGEGNSSFTQGAGFGLRGDSYNVYMAGGIALLRDGGGDDTYTAGVFAQATGYWEGTGILADAGGDDSWDSLWYTQAGAAHYSMAIFLDGGGNDRHNTTFTSPYNVELGSGHDYSVGVFIDESGDDTYVIPSLGAGTSNCQGRGVFVDNDGSDTYVANSTYAMGLGNHSGECESRQHQADSNALFLDSGGDADTYTWPAGDTRAPADDTSFGIAWDGTDDEHGGAVDGDGETGFHAAY